jgi:rfaE bifunctional protein kinase chain/domain
MSQRMKIRSIDEVVRDIAGLRQSRETIVHCHGRFDPLHLGTIRLLERAKELGDVLIVTLSPPADDGKEDVRAEVLSSLEVVDYVAFAGPLRSWEVIERLAPNVYVPEDDGDEVVRGADLLTRETATVEKGGGVLVPIRVKTSGSPIPIASGQPSLPPDTDEFLTSFLAGHSLEGILNHLRSIHTKRVLLIGDTIIDEYHYCETMGKSSKEPILAVKYLSAEKFAGGVVATANQAADFVGHVGLLSFLGSHDSHEEFIRQRLQPNVHATFLSLPGLPTTVKRRFLEIYPLQKLFEVYVMNDEIDPSCSKAMYARLEAELPSYDVVIVTDYGHGVITPEIVNLLCNKSKFLAINTQTNAANQGFNTVSKYPRADYICISEKELRLDARSRTKDLHTIVSDAAQRLSCGRVLVTRGQQGCFCYAEDEGFCHVPAFTQRVVDRIGAGDAVLAVTATCVAQGVPMNVVGFIGNSVGALAVETVGHRGIVSRAALCRHISSLLYWKSPKEMQR